MVAGTFLSPSLLESTIGLYPLLLPKLSLSHGGSKTHSVYHMLWRKLRLEHALNKLELHQWNER